MEERPKRAYGYLFFALIMLIMSWENSLASAALLTPTIPEQSIRIRILANSDSVEDQWVKKEVRKAVEDAINDWNKSYDTIEEARASIRMHLPEMKSLVDERLMKYGFQYGFQIKLGKVDFPAKVFGEETYPAGQYETLLITLGAGNGQNWWCVMFPPLCFGNGAVKAKGKKDSGVLMEKEDIVKSKDNVKSENGMNADDVEFRFFAVDVGKKIGKFIKGLFG